MRLAGCIALLLVAGSPVGAHADGAEDPLGVATREGLPTQLLESKRREALLKHVPQAQAAAVLSQLLGDLRQAQRLVLPDSADAARGRTVSAAAQALHAGATVEALASVLAAAHDARRRESAALAMASLLSAGVSSADAARLLRGALEGGLSDRLAAIRPALEALRRAGYAQEQTVATLAQAMTEGRAPLDVADDRIRPRESAGPRRDNGSPEDDPAASAAPDRDEGARSDVGARGTEHGTGRDTSHGTGRGAGDGKGGKP